MSEYRPGDVPVHIYVRGIEYKMAVLDDDEVELDPTLLIFRELEEEAVATVHLTPGAPCKQWPDHTVARERDE